MVVSENGGFPQQPWVFLLKMIILGCEMGVPPFKETPIWSAHEEPLQPQPVHHWTPGPRMMCQFLAGSDPRHKKNMEFFAHMGADFTGLKSMDFM